MKKPTTIWKESVSEYREFVQLRLRKRVWSDRGCARGRSRPSAGCCSYELRKTAVDIATEPKPVA